MNQSLQHPSETTANGVPAHRTALVLAGAGAAGNAWQLGLIAGLSDAGVDVTDADLVIGTSAGSTAAAQITSGRPPAELYTAVVAEAPPASGGGPGGGAGPGAAAGRSGAASMTWSDGIIGAARDASDLRRRLGAAALERDAPDEAGPTRWRRIVSARLPGIGWPQQLVLITAVDARTGEPVVFDRRSGVELVDAVAASTSNPFGGTYPIGNHRYINGGYRRSENADLASGYGRVLVLSPFGGRSRMPQDWGMDLATQVAELRAAGSRVETVFPDSGSGDVFDANALDPSTRPQAARGGHAQGRALAGRLGPFWRGDHPSLT
ncbi:patatin-like phospholipase family protein [Amnibacterium sp.]|uniref:patatin-like phospholipase family protein n=1 Tax=Amnibacterium sp. TaxID=1872496 RepID=UPI00345DA674